MVIDTNIVIHWLNGNEKIIELIEGKLNEDLKISVITEMEVMLGIEKENHLNEDTIRELVKRFEIVPLSSSIGNRAVTELKKRNEFSLRKVKIQDVVIACTALSLNEPLITLDKKDFKRFTGLEIICPDIQ